MGLDMYLTKKTYVKNWDFQTDEQKHQIIVKKGGKIRSDIKPERIQGIVEEVAYWRKANQIHKWFVDNVQDGEDDCREYYVGKDQLQKLLDLCNQVLEKSKLKDGKIVNGYQVTKNGDIPILEDGQYVTNPGVAQDLLPNSEGFFFGGQDYDQWYIQDLEYTRDTLTELLKEKNGDFYYQSSW